MLGVKLTLSSSGWSHHRRCFTSAYQCVISVSVRPAGKTGAIEKERCGSSYKVIYKVIEIEAVKGVALSTKKKIIRSRVRETFKVAWYDADLTYSELSVGYGMSCHSGRVLRGKINSLKRFKDVKVLG